MNVAFLLVLLLAINPPPSSSPTEPALLRGERTITKLKPGNETDTMLSRCGDHFLFWKNPIGLRPPGPRVGFMTEYRDGDPQIEGKDTTLLLAFLYEKLRVVIDNSKKLPTSRVVLTESAKKELEQFRGNDHQALLFAMRTSSIREVVIRISQADYKKASACLPTPPDT